MTCGGQIGGLKTTTYRRRKRGFCIRAGAEYRHVRTLQCGNPFKRRQDTGERTSDQPPERVEVHSELAPYHWQHEHEAEHDQKSESF
jgi:hypothetical protein